MSTQFVPAVSNPGNNPQEELAYIRRIIEESRQAFVEDGKPYITWGLIVALGMTFTYISALLNRDLGTGWVWIGLTVLGWLYVFFYGRQKEKTSRAKSIIDRVQSATWGAIGSMIGMFILLIFVGQALKIPDMPGIHPIYICFISAVLVGIGFYISGTVTDVAWVRNTAYAWWAGSAVMYLWPSVHVLGLYAAMILAFQVVPGIVLYRKYKRTLATA